MSQMETPSALLAALLALLVSLAVLPSPAAGAKPAQVTCRSFGRGFCETSCRYDLVRETCCRCFGDCCPTEDGGEKAPDDDDLLEDVIGGGDSEDSEESTSQQAAEGPAGKEPPEQLVLAPKSAGFLPIQPISALTTGAPYPAAPTCVEHGFPGDVHEDGSVWFSLARPCQVLRCSAGLAELILNNCATYTPPPLPPTTTATAPATSARHSYSCTDLSTGQTYQHGATWPSEGVNCVTYQCMNGTIQIASISCSSSAPELKSAVTQRPVTAPPLTPGPSSPDDSSGDAGSSCEDGYGQIQASGNVWTVSTQPCLRYSCLDGTILSSTITCAPTPTGDCSTLPALPGHCCPFYTCESPQRPLYCTYGGRTYRSGDVFADDPLHPCQQLKCDDGIVVALSPPTSCLAVYCAEPDWPEGVCCKTCPGETLPAGLEELKQLVLKMGQRLNLPTELMTRLEDNVNRLVAQLAALMRDSDSAVTLHKLVTNLIEMTGILNALETAVVDLSVTDTEVLLVQLRVRLLALVERLQPKLNDDQIYNANIDIGEFIAWLRAFQTAGRASAASILMNDLTRLFSGLLMEPGCTDTVGTVHPVDTLYVDNPGSPQLCYVCANLTSGVAPLAVMKVSDCGGPPPPGCSAQLVPNSCCPHIQCTPGEAACRDDLGELHPHGSTYVDDPSSPCITYNCTNGVATIVDKISCMPIPPGCSPWKREGFCCPKSDCPESSCLYEGWERDHGTTWPQEPLIPCLILTCLKGQVTSEDRSEQCQPSPAEHCEPRQVNYQCCPQYDCVTVNCTYNGRVYREEQTWPDDPRHPCKRYRCTRQGTERIQDLSELCDPQPHAKCTGHRATGQCCKQWTCPQCIYGSRNYSEGEIFWDSTVRRCAQLMCREGQTVQLTPPTTCPPIPDSCTPNYVGTSCCHVKYTCPFCMFDPQGNLVEMAGGVKG